MTEDLKLVLPETTPVVTPKPVPELTTKPKTKTKKAPKVDPRDEEIRKLQNEFDSLKMFTKELMRTLPQVADARTRHRAHSFIQNVLRKKPHFI